MIRLALLGIAVFAATTTLWADVQSAIAKARNHGPSPEVASYQQGEEHEVYRLRIVNDANGAISGSPDGGATWEPLGHVLQFTTKVSNQGYTASKWAPVGSVAATAVNAIHIRTGFNAQDDKGVVFSLLPADMQAASAEKLHSFLSPNSSIYTDIPAGKSIFGGHWSPILGSPIYLQQDDDLVRIAEDYVPRQGDVLVIRVLEPDNMPKAFIFENRFGGFIIEQGWNGEERAIGQVLRPVCGVGRFTGSQYADVGRIRANHSGVICVSVAPYGQIGGFQIIPREHAMSPEMVRARTMTQWMVVGPLDARDPSWEGVPPLFSGYLRPVWDNDDWNSPSWVQQVARRVLVDVRVTDGPWQPMPTYVFDSDLSKPLPAWANTALQDITHIRISMPVPESL